MKVNGNNINNKSCSSSAQLSSAQLHFKLFSSLCLLINYKNYYIYFEFIFDKIVYLYKLLFGNFTYKQVLLFNTCSMIKYKKYKLKIKELKMYKNFYKNSKSNKGGVS